MDAVIDLGTELLLDESAIRDPYLRLLVAAFGERVVSASPWVAVNKGVAALWFEPFRKARARRLLVVEPPTDGRLIRESAL